jgi:hypothetical protein
MRPTALQITTLLLALPGWTGAATYVASPSGTAAAAGSSAASPTSLAKAFAAAAAGDSVVLLAGTYSIPYVAGAKNTLTLSAKGTQAAPISVAARGGRAVLDFSFPEDTYVQDSYGILASGAWWSFRGIDITRAGYQGVYVTGSHNTFVNCTFHDNRNSGMEINKGGEYTTVIDCDSYRNYDPKKTGTMSDGFASKQLQGPGNTFHGCRAWENSDDGWDTYQSTQPVVLDSCWTWGNGYYKGKAVGNGNGFKLGGDDSLERNVARRCVSFQNLARGFDQNSNVGGITLIGCTSYKNGTQNFSFAGTLASGEKNTFTNNLSYLPGSADQITNATSTTNSWNLSVTVSAADFASLDTVVAHAARDADGHLPHTNFLALVAGSDLIDVGTSTGGLPYLGKAPDLGAIEYSATTSLSSREVVAPKFTARWSQGVVHLSGDLEGGLVEVWAANGCRVAPRAVTAHALDLGAVPSGVYRVRAGSRSASFLVP